MISDSLLICPSIVCEIVTEITNTRQRCEEQNNIDLSDVTVEVRIWSNLFKGVYAYSTWEKRLLISNVMKDKYYDKNTESFYAETFDVDLGCLF